ncbi:MAG: hypothetical protein ACP5XB_02285 [Isosphaeraceae bacterium]
MPKPLKSLFDVSYPNITLWVQGYGTVEFGYDPQTGSFIRAMDEGGMVWSGNRSYKTLDDALQDLEKGLGKALLDLGLGVQPSAPSRQSARRSTSKQNQGKRQKTPSEPALPKQVQKLEEIVEAIRGKEIVQVTRLTVVKKLCENQKAAGAFAMFLAQKALGRLREKRSNERYVELADRAIKKITSFLGDPTDVRRQQLRSLLLEIQAEQNEYASIKWSAARNIKSWDLLIVENALGSILNRDEAPIWLYQAARDYVGSTMEFEQESIPQLEEIVRFWQEHFSIKA